MSSERLDTEQKDRVHVLEIVEGLEGFMRLSEKQQQIIRTSIYIQDRAKRPAPESGNYDSSKRNVKGEYCHSATYCLEHELPLGQESYDHDAKEMELLGKLSVIVAPSFEELSAHVADTEFPVVVHIGTRLSGEREDLIFDGFLHSCIALGRDKNGEIIVWDKQGGGQKYPYRIVTLKEVFQFYSRPHMGWGTRSLQHT